MSELTLLKIQSGKETTFGTPVTDTVKHMDIPEGGFSVEPIVESKVLRTQRGNLTSGYNAALMKTGAKWKISGGFATYEDINYWVEMLFGVATPSGGGPYVRAGTSPGTTIVTPRMQTFYYGDATGGIYKMTSAVASKLTLKYTANEEVTFDIEGFGKTVASGASFAALSDRTVTPIIGNDLLLYIDAFGGTIGSTAIASTFYSAELEIDTQRSEKFYLGGVAPGAYKQPDWRAKLTMHLEYNATSAAYLNAQLAPVALQKLVRLKATTGASAIHQMDFAGTMTKAPSIFTDEDGVASVDFELEDTYESTFAAILKYSNTCGTAVLA